MNKATDSALRAYRAECKRLFDGRGKLGIAAALHAELKAAFAADPGRARFAGFPDFLACNDALPLAELRAELAA